MRFALFKEVRKPERRKKRKLNHGEGEGAGGGKIGFQDSSESESEEDSTGNNKRMPEARSGSVPAAKGKAEKKDFGKDADEPSADEASRTIGNTVADEQSRYDAICALKNSHHC